MKNTQKIRLILTIVYNIFYVFIFTGWTDKIAVKKAFKDVLFSPID